MKISRFGLHCEKGFDCNDNDENTYQGAPELCDTNDNNCDGKSDSGQMYKDVCCEQGQICHLQACIPNTGSCKANGDCQEDSYCNQGQCVPYDMGETNPDCTRLSIAGLFQPALQCQWTAPGPGDFDTHIQVLGTPVVADFDFDRDPETTQPSIVFLSYDGLDGVHGESTDLDGVIRIVDGKTCETQFSMGPYLNGSNPPAIGDLDGDGRWRCHLGIRSRKPCMGESIRLFWCLWLHSGGGPPTVGDFDGDGRAELAAAGSDAYTVFDPDCTDAPQAKFCPSLRTDGILWSRPSQDHSSNITGSSLFDFEGDGVVEAIYADECFVRVYNGIDGTVLYSQWRSSCTWNENPIVADVDGDFASELVVPSNQNCGVVPETMGGQAYDTSPAGNPMDPLFTGLPCKQAADCASGICDANFCRCTEDSHCGDAGSGFVCAPPPGGTPGTGNTCRAEWQGKVNGIRVYRDVLDRWVGSRTIWNQHAYAVTNVLENGTVPRTSQAEQNWQVLGLNNFRQNIQGDLNPEHSPDMTSGLGTFANQCAKGTLALSVRVCNRGTHPIGSGVDVGFFDGDASQADNLVCETQTNKSLQPGECEMIKCSWENAPTDDPRDVTVMVDHKTQRTECLETNNKAMIFGATCPIIPR